MASLPPLQASDGAHAARRSAPRKQAQPGFEDLFGQAVQGAPPLPAVASAKAGSASAPSSEQATITTKQSARGLLRTTGRIPEGLLETIRAMRGPIEPLANKAAVLPLLSSPQKPLSSKDVRADVRAETRAETPAGTRHELRNEARAIMKAMSDGREAAVRQPASELRAAGAARSTSPNKPADTERSTPTGQLDARGVHLLADGRKATPSASTTPLQPERAVATSHAPSTHETHPLAGDRPLPGINFRVMAERAASPSKSAADATARNDNAMLRQLANLRMPMPFMQGLTRLGEATIRGVLPPEKPGVVPGRRAERAADGASDKKGPARGRVEAHTPRPEAGMEAAPRTPVADPTVAMKHRTTREEEARRTPAGEYDQQPTPNVPQVETPVDATRATIAAERPEGRREHPAERPAGAALAPVRGSDTPAPMGAEKATRPGSARSAQTPEWVQAILNRGPEAPGAIGSKTLEMQLDNGDGTVTINVLRNPEKVVVSVGFSDPALQARSEAQMAQIVDALQMHYQANVDVSFAHSGGESVFDQTPARPQGGGHGPSRGEVASPETIPTEPARAGIGGRYVWVG